ncbi:uncharacterized protein LOC111132478 [Crassostrea virginica]
MGFFEKRDFSLLFTPQECCNNYYFIDDTCQECQPGLYGENCSEPCPYPSFGAKCIRTCVCGESICNAATGCLNHSKTQITENTEIFTSHTVFLAVTVALGLSLLVIILLVVLLYRRHHVNGILNVQSHEQQLVRQQERDSRILIRPTVRNTYRSINSVLGNPKPDIPLSNSHPILEKEDSYKCMTATKQKKDIQTAGTEQYEQLNLGDAATYANENCS